MVPYSKSKKAKERKTEKQREKKERYKKKYLCLIMSIVPQLTKPTSHFLIVWQIEAIKVNQSYQMEECHPHPVSPRIIPSDEFLPPSDPVPPITISRHSGRLAKPRLMCETVDPIVMPLGVFFNPRLRIPSSNSKFDPAIRQQPFTRVWK